MCAFLFAEKKMFNDFNKKIYWVALKLTFEESDSSKKDEALFYFEKFSKKNSDYSIEVIKQIIFSVYGQNKKELLDCFIKNKNYIFKNNNYMF